jgi:2-oxo-3-hexenedioate decarboxylase/2-keto-4-pentenoate hydratase
MTDPVVQAAELLAAARVAREPFDRFPPGLVPRTVVDGYRIQGELHRLLAPRLGARGGWKIGCTTPVMQAYLGIDTPSSGVIWASTIHHGDATIAIGPHRLGVECELAVRLGADLDAPPAALTRERVATGVVGVMAAIEIVEDRFVDYRSLDAGTMIADDFFGAGCVLGPETTDWRAIDLGAVSATMEIDGELVGSGAGRDILGDPLAALAWLAASQASLGEPLRAGEVVLLGSLVQTRWVERGSRVVVRNDPLGEVRVSFTRTPSPPPGSNGSSGPWPRASSPRCS